MKHCHPPGPGFRAPVRADADEYHRHHHGDVAGLGAALFAAYLEHDVRVCALSRGFTRDQQRAGRVHPTRVILHHGDLADTAALPNRDAIAAMLAAAPPASSVLLVHNAAVVTPIGRIGALDPHEIATAVRVNVLTPMLLTNACAAGLPSHVDAVRVVYLTTTAISNPYPGWATYRATKAAADLCIRCAAGGADPRTTVQVLDPGAMDTAMHTQPRRHGAGLPGHDRLLRRHAHGDPADVATVAHRTVAQTLRPVGGRSGTARTAQHS